MIGRPAALLFLLAACGFAQDPARLEQIVQSYVAGNHFMGTVLVAKGDQVILSKGYGSANLEWNIPDTPSTKFRLGSITKQFTAARILLLEERGKLKIEDPLRKYMADAPPAWDKITIYNVLTHTSGIPNFTSFPDYATTEALPSPAEKTVSRFRDKPLDFEPGLKFSYSNSGYVLLGYLIQKISGQSYDKFLQENIFCTAGNEGFGIRFQLRRDRASRRGVCSGRRRADQCRFRQHDHTRGSGRAVLNHGRSTQMGAGSVWWQGAFGGVSSEDDHTI